MLRRMEGATTRSELSRSIVPDEQRAQPQSGVWGTLLHLAAGAADAMSSCFGRTLRVNARVYKLNRMIAEGGFSYVWAATDTVTGDQVAVKQILCQSAEQRAAVRHEVDVHLALSPHPNIARLVDYSFERLGDDGSERAHLVLPLWRSGSVQDFILPRLPRGPFYTEREALRVFLGVCRGVRAFHAHEPPWAHRDLCPRNIMIGDATEPVLIDFGSATVARVEIHSRADALALQDIAAVNSSMPYRAPELWDPQADMTVSEKTDVWSLGCILFCMAFGYSPFESARGADGRLYICEPSHLRVLGRPEFPVGHNMSKDFCELIVLMLAQDPHKRPDIHELIVQAARLFEGGGRRGVTQPVAPKETRAE